MNESPEELARQIAEKEKALEEEVNKKIQDQRVILEEKEEVKKFQEEVSKNAILNREGITTIKKEEIELFKNQLAETKRKNKFWKRFFLFWTFILLILVVIGIYLCYTDKINLNNLIHPTFNSPVDVKNNYSFSSNTNNEYSHNIDGRDYNNFTFITKNYYNCQENETQ
jgi:hypothetical protein